MKLRSASSTSVGNFRDAREKSSLLSPKDVFAMGTTTRKANAGFEITNVFAVHLAKDMVWLSSVEKDGFSGMIQTLDPSYVILSRKY